MGTHRISLRAGSRLWLCLAAAAFGPLIRADDPPATSAPADNYAQLRAEISSAKPIYAPGEPVLIRCTLFNPSEEGVNLPVEKGEEGRITLPAGVIFGREESALSYAWETEKAAPVRNAASGELTGTLRLDPHASLGAEIDLKPYVKLIRYSGEYTLEWRPFGERGPTATTHFRVETRKNVVLITDYGKMTFVLNYEKAPKNVENFLDLARNKVYDGASFHRVIANFLIQGGSPDGTQNGARSDGKTVPGEFRDSVFDIGTLAMAHRKNDPNSASAQFFISLDRQAELDGKYSVVGQARDEASLRTLRTISELPTDKDDRPVRPVVIRFVTLVDVDPAMPEHLEVSRP